MSGSELFVGQIVIEGDGNFLDQSCRKKFPFTNVTSTLGSGWAAKHYYIFCGPHER